MEYGTERPNLNNKLAYCNSFLNKAIYRVLLGCQCQRQIQRLYSANEHDNHEGGLRPCTTWSITTIASSH
jgi:hypothetical protein